MNLSAFQGFEIGDQCYYNIITNCTANGITNASGVGFLVQYANGLQPQYNILNGNSAIQCPTGFSITGALYTNIIGGAAVACVNGYSVQLGAASTCAENSIQDVLATSNSNVGIVVGTSVGNTLLTGRSVANTVANLSNAGTNTISTNLITV